MDLINWVLLILTVIGTIGSIPVLVDAIRVYRYGGVNIAGTWKTEWIGKDGISHNHITKIRQRGEHVKMYADNQWQNVFVGRVIGNHVLGTWSANVQGVFDFGVFIMRLKTIVPPEMEGEFTGFDDQGQNLEIMHTKIVKINNKSLSWFDECFKNYRIFATKSK